jgi:hypothetical protein
MSLCILSAYETAIVDVKQVSDEVMGLAAGFLQVDVKGDRHVWLHHPG